MKTYNTVKEYIDSFPEDIQTKLKEMRSLIKDLVPEAKESISYSMPFYDYKGRLVYFAAATKHIGLYIPPPIIDHHKKELAGYKTSKSAVQFPLEEPLPKSLIITLIKARIVWNTDSEKKKKTVKK